MSTPSYTEDNVQHSAGRALRLRMTPRLVHANRLDGAWWPRSTDLVTELPPLLHAVSKRIGRIRGVLLNQDEWLPTTVDWTPAGNNRVRIGWYGHQEAHMAVLIGDSSTRIDLLVIPSATDPRSASAAVVLATTMGNSMTGPEALRSATMSSQLAGQRAGSDLGGANAPVSN